MYGMLLESVQHYVVLVYGDEAWLQILDQAELKTMVFTTHRCYNDRIMVKLASSCATVLQDRSRDEYMEFFGRCFVDYCAHYGYDRILRVSGRHFRDFLNGIDNLHETMRFSYPKMLSPSFFVEREDKNGCILHYRSKRVGFTHYVIGQLKRCGKKFYDVDVSVEIWKEETNDSGCHVVYRLNFANFAYVPQKDPKISVGIRDYSQVSTATFFKVSRYIYN
jgi:guanylate cyclase